MEILIMKKNILITGIAGFIGMHTALKLQKNGYNVIGCDNFNNYYDVALKNERAAILKKNGVSVFKGDICDPKFMGELIDSHNTTHLLNLAAQAGVRYSLENPGAYIASNISGFVNILEQLRQRPHIKFVYASSSSVYGNNTKTPFSTNDRTDLPASLYGATKKSNELLAYTYHHLFKISSVGLRFFTVYGPWGRPDMAYYSFTKKILAGETIDVYNHGKLSRDFTYIDDIVMGIEAALECENCCEIFNLGNNQPESLENFISTIEKALNIKAIKNYVDMQPGDVLQTYADIDRSKEKLNYQPITSLQTGIERFIVWYKNYYHKS